MTSQPCATDQQPPAETPSSSLSGVEKRRSLPLKTGIRAGDMYMHNPRGSSNRISDP
jgi:hypothetical protein